MYTVRLFSRKERGHGNKIVFTASNLQCASLNTKLAFVAMVDRGAMTPNEWRETMNMAPIADGDKPIRRLDTQVVDMIQNTLAQMNDKNYIVLSDLIVKMLDAAERSKDETQDKHPGCNDTE